MGGLAGAGDPQVTRYNSITSILKKYRKQTAVRFTADGEERERERKKKKKKKMKCLKSSQACGIRGTVMTKEEEKEPTARASVSR